jgi:uncharacterized membrane protein
MSLDLKSKSNEDTISIRKIESQLVEVDPKIFDGISQEKKHRIMKSVVLTMHKSHKGPLPDAETLAEYSVLIPNGADRIMKMAEQQLQHRMSMENSVVKGQMLQSNIGQVLAFLIGLAAIGAATYCIVNGHDFSGSILGVGGLTSLVTAFIKGKSQQSRNLEERHPRPKQ